MKTLTFRLELRQQAPGTLMADQVAQVVARVGLEVLLQVGDGKGDIKVPDVLYGDNFIKLLETNRKRNRVIFIFCHSAVLYWSL